jgi:hypothetical protein
LQVIHFTEGAADPLQELEAHGARFVQLAEGSGESHLGCLHLGAGGKLPRRSIYEASALLTVHGSVTFIEDSGLRLEVAGGMGVMLIAHEFFALESLAGGIMVLIRCRHLKASEGGISTPQRISGQRWPGEASPGGMGDP